MTDFYIHSVVDQTNIIKAKLDASGLLKGVFYGDEELAPQMPVAFCSAGLKRREVHSTHRYRVDLMTMILVLHSKVGDVEGNTQANQQLTEQIEDLLNQDPNLKDTSGNDRVIWGFVTRLEPGVARRREIMYQTSRIVWEAQSRESF